MIKLSLPSERHNHYLMLDGFLLGPLGLLGTPPMDTVSVRSVADTLNQGRTLYHENDVDHVKYDGNLSLIPGHQDMRAAPTFNDPDRIFFDCFTTNGLEKTLSVPKGLGVSGRASISYSGSFTRQIACISASPFHFETVEVIAQSQYPNLGPDVTRTIYTFEAQTAHNVGLKRQYLSYRATDEVNSSWLSPRSFGEILNCGSIMGRAMPVATATQYWGIYRIKTPFSYSVSSIYNTIDSFVSSKFRGVNHNLEGKHFGDLASQAAESVNRSDVNMIAFLKDLRKPKELIPKLKELRKLKTHSDNYLGAKYGILPTISDLRTIVDALKRVAPYIDKNGFSTYNAAHSESEARGDYTLALEQRIKIAIANEDSHLIEMINRIDSAGFAPTLENIWDLIPYSFVLDWFIDVGDFLERIDNTFRLERLNIKYVTMSTKKTISTILKPNALAPVSGAISVVYYQRWTHNQSPLPPLSLASENKLPSHWLEATALIYSRAKK